MTPPPRPDPIATAARLTGAAKDAADGLAEGFRRSDRPFKVRVGIVGTWVVLALLSIWIACQSPGPRNGLGALARLEFDRMMGTQVLVQNDGSHHWTDVVLILDGTWRAEQRTVRSGANGESGDKLVLALSAFAKDGQPPPADLRPKELRIECSEGHATIQLGAKR